MEFIKAYAEAKELGLSKEEFLPIWETEAKMKLKAEEAKVLQLQQNCIPVNTNHLHESELESGQQTDKLINEIRQLNKRFDFAEQSLISKFEQQKQQIQQQTNEFRQQFQRLSDNLKVWMKTLKASVAEVGSEGLRDLESQKREVMTKEQSLASSFEKFLHLKSQQGEAATNQHQELNLPDNGPSVWDFYDQPRKLDEQNKSNDIGANATANSKQHSVVGTGKFADAISSMMTQDVILQGQNSAQVNGKATPSYLSESNGLDGFQEVLKHDRKRNIDTVKTDHSITFFPHNGAEFVIPNFTVFQSKSKDFYTESLYTRPKACKVRLRLWFNKHGRLGVHLLVSEGVFDERYQWPMIFSGNGYIFNQGSQTYTRLWVINSQMCSMPERNREVTLGASVCLETSRDPCDDVTCDLLVKKRYVSDGDRLLFKWSMKAVENKGDQQASALYLG